MQRPDMVSWSRGGQRQVTSEERSDGGRRSGAVIGFPRNGKQRAAAVIGLYTSLEFNEFYVFHMVSY